MNVPSEPHCREVGTDRRYWDKVMSETGVRDFFEVLVPHSTIGYKGAIQKGRKENRCGCWTDDNDAYVVDRRGRTCDETASIKIIWNNEEQCCTEFADWSMMCRSVTFLWRIEFGIRGWTNTKLWEFVLQLCYVRRQAGKIVVTRKKKLYGGCNWELNFRHKWSLNSGHGWSWREDMKRMMRVL